MSKITCELCLAGAIAVLGSTASFAQNSIPDLTGLWSAEGQVAINPYGPENEDNEPVFTEVALLFEILKQDGVRLAGVERAQEVDPNADKLAVNEVFVGIVSSDGTELSMVDNNGDNDCKIISPVELHCIYRHFTSKANVVAGTVWKKQE